MPISYQGWWPSATEFAFDAVGIEFGPRGIEDAASTGDASGIGGATGVGAVVAVGAGSAFGSGDAIGAGAAFYAAIGSAGGAGDAAGVGAAISAAAGAAFGVSAESGVSSGTIAEAVGAAAGAGAATGGGFTGSVAEAVGAAAGVGAAGGSGFEFEVLPMAVSGCARVLSGDCSYSYSRSGLMTTTCIVRGPTVRYLRGTTLRSEMVFEVPTELAVDPDAPWVDPDQVFLSIRRPGDSPTIETFEYGVDDEVVKDSTGHYHSLFVADEDGEWVIRWSGVGTYAAVDEVKLVVRPGAFYS